MLDETKWKTKEFPNEGEQSEQPLIQNNGKGKWKQNNHQMKYNKTLTTKAKETRKKKAKTRVS